MLPQARMRVPRIIHRKKGELEVFFAERDWGSFTRSLRFPQHIVGDRIDASFDNGVFTITIPKAEAAKPRKIVINTAAETKSIGSLRSPCLRDRATRSLVARSRRLSYSSRLFVRPLAQPNVR